MVGVPYHKIDHHVSGWLRTVKAPVTIFIETLLPGGYINTQTSNASRVL